MSAVVAIARNTMREALRDRVLYLILFFAVGVILASEAIAVLAVGSPEKVTQDLGLSAISFFGAMLSVFLGLSLVSKEIERRTVYTVVSKPITRSSFVVGKLAGLMATQLILVGGMGTVFLVFVRLRHGIEPARLVPAIALGLFECLVLASFAILFSSFTTPILGAMFSVTTYVVGHLCRGLKMLAGFEWVSETVWRKVLLLLYYVLPNLERFNIRGQAVYGEPVAPGLFVSAAAYGLSYAVAVLLLAMVVFARRDLT